MVKAFWDDFRFAQTTGVAVEVHLLSGEKLLKGVHEVHEEENFVSLYAPTMLGDDPTTRKIDGGSPIIARNPAQVIGARVAPLRPVDGLV